MKGRIPFPVHNEPDAVTASAIDTGVERERSKREYEIIFRAFVRLLDE